MQKWMVSVATARGAVGVKTPIGTITPPPWAKRISAVWCNALVGALLTTAASRGKRVRYTGSASHQCGYRGGKPIRSRLEPCGHLCFGSGAAGLAAEMPGHGLFAASMDHNHPRISPERYTH